MHTPSEIGFWSRASTLRVAAALGEPLAGAYILRVRELFVLHADRAGRLPSEFNAVAIAAAAGFKGRPARLIRVLEGVGLLGARRGRFFYPGFSSTETGRYVELRELGREKKREQRRRLRQGGEESNEESDLSAGRPRDRVGDVSETDPSKEVREPEGPPEAPPSGGSERAGALWEWFRQTYPKLANPKETQRLLGLLDEHEEQQLRYCLPLQLPRYMSAKKTKGWRFVPFSPKYLRDGRFWELQPGPAAPPPDPVALELSRRQAEERKQLDERAHREMVAYSDIKRQLQQEGFRGIQLVELADARLEEWRQRQQHENLDEDSGLRTVQ